VTASHSTSIFDVIPAKRYVSIARAGTHGAIVPVGPGSRASALARDDMYDFVTTAWEVKR